jgi:hypothetical protein
LLRRGSFQGTIDSSDRQGPARRMQAWLGHLTASVAEPRWSARRTLGFILAACAAAWMLIGAGVWYLFLRR